MKKIERRDLVKAVLASRDEVDPGLETELLEAIVDAETASAGDSDAAMRAIDSAVTAAISRGVGYVQEADAGEAIEDVVNGDGEDEEDGRQC